jgi:hypothetical protein
MTAITDETLMALVNDELEPAEAARRTLSHAVTSNVTRSISMPWASGSTSL